MLPRPQFVKTRLFANLIHDDIHTPLPPIKNLTIDDVRQMGMGNSLVVLKYVIKPDGELIISKPTSELIPLTSTQINQFGDLLPNDTMMIDGQAHPAITLSNSDKIIFDPQTRLPKWQIIQLKHPEISGGSPVIMAGDVYVMNGAILPYHPQGKCGVDNWTGHFAVNGPHQKEIVESVFQAHGFKEAAGIFRDRATREIHGGHHGVRREPNILTENYKFALPQRSFALKPPVESLFTSHAPDTDAALPVPTQFYAPQQQVMLPARVAAIPSPPSQAVIPREMTRTIWLHNVPIQGHSGTLEVQMAAVRTANGQVQNPRIVSYHFQPEQPAHFTQAQIPFSNSANVNSQFNLPQIAAPLLIDVAVPFGQSGNAVLPVRIAFNSSASSHARPVITIEGTSRGQSSSSFRGAARATGNFAGKLLSRGVVAYKLYNNVRESGDLVAGYYGTCAELGTTAVLSRALSSVSSVPLLAIRMTTFAPDPALQFQQTMQIAGQYTPLLPVQTPVQDGINYITSGNPWGVGAGLLHPDMDMATKVRLANEMDPELLHGRMTFAGVQRFGHVASTVIRSVVHFTVQVVKAINPFSVSDLHAPDHHRELPPAASIPYFLHATRCESPTRIFSIYDNHNRVNGFPLENMDDVPLPSQMLQEMELEAVQPAAQRFNGNTSQVATFKPPVINFEHSVLPEWVQGVGVVGSLASGWKVFFVTQLTWASFGAGLAVLGVAELISYFMNKHEASKQKRRARNTKRVHKQCDVIYNDTQRPVTLIDQAIALANQYLSETDPVKKAELYAQLKAKVSEASQSNNHERSVNETRMHDSNQRVDGHKIRRRSRAYCQSIHEIFSDNSRLLNQLDDVVIIGASYGDLEGRQMTETDPGKIAMIKTLLGAKDAENAQKEAERRQASIAASQTKIDEALKMKDFAAARMACEASEMSADEKAQEIKSIDLNEQITNDNLKLVNIDAALDANDYDLANTLCDQLEMTAEEKLEIKEEIAEERAHYQDVRFTNKLKAANEGISLVNNVMTLFLQPASSPVREAIPMTDNQDVAPVQAIAWKQSVPTVAASQSGKFRAVGKLPDALQNKQTKTKVTKLKL